MQFGKLSKIKMLIMHHFMEQDELTGYSFRKDLGAKGIPISNGSLYPVLNELEELGILKSSMDGKRKVYKETAKSQKMRKEINHSFPQEISMPFFQLARSMPLVQWDDIKQVTAIKQQVDELSQAIEIVFKKNN